MSATGVIRQLGAEQANFRMARHPTMMRFVPKATRQEWHERALDAAKGADLHSLLKLFVETKAMERLAELVRASGLVTGTTFC
jgi:hypothetical protein